jgi:hypothetical protein
MGRLGWIVVAVGALIAGDAAACKQDGQWPFAIDATAPARPIPELRGVAVWNVSRAPISTPWCGLQAGVWLKIDAGAATGIGIELRGEAGEIPFDLPEGPLTIHNDGIFWLSWDEPGGPIWDAYAAKLSARIVMPNGDRSAWIPFRLDLPGQHAWLVPVRRYFWALLFGGIFLVLFLRWRRRERAARA